MKKLGFLSAICLLFIAPTITTGQVNPIVNEDVIFEEKNGTVAVEAEYFYKQSMNDVRQWYRFTKDEAPKAGEDRDPNHVFGASNNCYMEILPDTRVTHGDKLIAGTNFAGSPGVMAFLHYKVYFNTPGKYYVWVRAYSCGSEDNGLHVGLDGEWPESGARLQWCEGKHSWKWESKQRTEKNHCGEPFKIFLDIKEAGEHEIMFSMREDGFEFDKFVLTTNKNFKPGEGTGPAVNIRSGKLPAGYPEVGLMDEVAGGGPVKTYTKAINPELMKMLAYYKAKDFPVEGSKFYVDQERWLAINPAKAKKSTSELKYTGESKKVDIIFLGVGENDGSSSYTLNVAGTKVGSYSPPMSKISFEEGTEYCFNFKDIELKKGDIIAVTSEIGSADGKEYSRGRWGGIVLTETGKGDAFMKSITRVMGAKSPAKKAELKKPEITGELKKWHKVTLTFDGEETAENAKENPFMNNRFNVTFSHKESGKSYLVPGYFAADGNAGNTSATSGNKWRVHFAPDEVGTWNYKVEFFTGPYAAVAFKKRGKTGVLHNAEGSFKIEETDKSGNDMRAKGMLKYDGTRYLKFAETGEYFLKVGSDAPENMLSYEEFDGTFHNDGHKDNLVKTWEAHEKHWKEGDPTWQNGKGKDIIGAVNYLADKGMNAFSFLTMNIGGDDQNVFPFIDYNTYDRYDCSKLDQWETLFEHADMLGMFLHFKTLEHENQGLLDNGGVGANTKLYYRELIARFGHHLAMNWNICEETGDWGHLKTPPQDTWHKLAAAAYFHENDPYHHHIVIHNGNWFDDIYGHHSYYTGASLQTNQPDFKNVHKSTLKILNDSKAKGKQWAVACDEPGDAQHSLLPDAEDPEHNNARMNGLWGHFMAGGWGTEWYFGYKHPHSDLTCQDYASRDLFWDQGKVALDFFANHKIPFWKMESKDELVLNENDYAFVKEGEIYVFYLKNGTAKVNLSSASGKLNLKWYNPRTGGALQTGSKKKVKAGTEVDLGSAPAETEKDWVVVVKPQ